MLYSGKNGLSKPSYNPFLPTRGTLTDPIACAQQRHRQKVPNDKRDDPAAWEPKKVPRELQKILPDESYNKDEKKYHMVDTIAKLPDLCIFQILKFLPLNDLGRVACWSKFWREYSADIYDERYWVEANKVREKMLDIWYAADKMWGDHVGRHYAYIHAGTSMMTIKLWTQPSTFRRRKQWQSPIANVRIPTGMVVPTFPDDIEEDGVKFPFF